MMYVQELNKGIDHVIKNNTAIYGAGVVIDYAGCLFKNNIVAGNSGGQDYGGGGFWMIGNGTEPVIIENNNCYVFTENNNYEKISAEISTEIKSNTKSSIPFEFLVLECILQYKLKEINREFNLISSQIEGVLADLQNHISDENLEKVSEFQMILGDKRILVQEIGAELREVIEDEDFKNDT